MEDEELNPYSDPFGTGATPLSYDEITRDTNLRDFEVEFVAPEEKPVRKDGYNSSVSPGDPNLAPWDYVADMTIGPITEGIIHRARLTDERGGRNSPNAPVWNVEGYEPEAKDIIKWADEYGLSESFFNGLAQATSPDDLEARARQYGDAVLRDVRLAQEGSSFGGWMKQTAIAMLDPGFLVAAGGLHVLAKGWVANTAFGVAVKGGAIEGGAAAIVEGAKFAYDPTQSVEEAAFSVVGSAVLGGAFEAAGHGISTTILKQADRQLADAAASIAAARARRQDLIDQGLLEETAHGDLEPIIAPGSSVGAAQNPNTPVLRVSSGYDVNPDAPEKSAFGRWGTPMDWLARSPDPDVRSTASKLVWDPLSNLPQGVDAGAATRRIYEAGTVFSREARMAATAWARENKKATRGLLNPFAQASTDTLNEFMTIVAQVHAGVRESTDANVMRAVKAYQDGYSDALAYLKNSSYNGPGSEGLAGLSNEDFADIEDDPRYVMRRFSSPGWREVLARHGRERLATKLSSAIERGNTEWLESRARKLVEDEMLAAGRTLPGSVVSSPPATPAPTPQTATPQGSGAAAPEPPKPTAPVKGYTAEELFGGKPPKTGLKEGDAWYTAQMGGKQSVVKFIDTLVNPENFTPKERTRILKAIFEAEGIEDAIPQAPENVRKRLTKMFNENRKAADKARGPSIEETLNSSGSGGSADPSRELPDRIAMMRAAKAKLDAAKAGDATPASAAPTPAAAAPTPATALSEAELDAAIKARVRTISDSISSKYLATVMRVMDPATKMVDLHSPVTREYREAAKDIIRAEFNGSADFSDDIEEAIEMMLDLIAPVKDTAKDSNRARSRLKLDLKAGLDDDLLPMYDWNAEALYTTYRRQTAGLSGFLKAGYTSMRQFDAEVARIRSKEIEYPDEENRLRVRKDADKLELLKGTIMGTPPDWVKPGSEDWMFMATMLRRYNFTRQMNNTGFLSFSEIMGSMVQMGPMRLLTSLPAYRKYIKDIRAGDPKAMESIMWIGDALMGHGSSQVRSRLNGFSNLQEDDALAPILDRQSGKLRDRLDRFTRKASNATSRLSGMAPIAEWLRTSMVGMEAQAWVLKARKGAMPYSQRRMKALGISSEMWVRISDNLNKMGNVTSPDTGQARPFIDFTAWEDGEAANVFMNALDRNSRRLMQEGDAGHTPFWMSHPIAGIMTQFLRYPLNAWTKQTRFALNVHDTRALAEASAMALGGGIGHLARISAIAMLAKDEGKERDEYLKQMSDPREVAKAMAYYSAHGSMIPNAWDTGVQVVGTTGVFDGPGGEELRQAMSFSKTRASGSPADLITGNPTYQWVNRGIPKSLEGITQGAFTENDLEQIARTFSPLGNHLAMLSAVNAIGNLLPPEEED